MQHYEEEDVRASLLEENAIFVDINMRDKSKRENSQLLQLDFNFASLNEYLRNIIHVIN